MSNNFKSIGTIYREMNMKKEAAGLDDVSALQALELRMRTVEEQQAAPDNGAGAGEYGSDKAKKQYQKDTPGQGGNIETDPTHTSTLPLAVDGIPKKGGEMIKPDMDKNAGIKTDPVKAPSMSEAKETCSCGCDCGKAVCESCGKAHAEEDIKESEFVANLDPVGQGDGDIDNDGDKDKSDKYLKKRRKAISKAIAKEEKEVVLESGAKLGKVGDSHLVHADSSDGNWSSPKASGRSMGKAGKDDRHHFTHSGKTIDVNDYGDKSHVKKQVAAAGVHKDHQDAIASHIHKFVNESVESVDKKGFGESRKFVAPGFMEDFSVTLKPHPTEKNKYKVHSVGKKLAAHGGMKAGETVHDSHIDDMHDSGIKVNHYKEEVVQELSAKTLGSYIKKASSPVVKNSALNLASKGATKLAHSDDLSAGEKEDSKAFTRGKSIGIAAKKLVKKVSEMVEIDEISTELVKKVAHKRAINTSMAGSKADYDRRDPDYQKAAAKQQKNQTLRFNRGAKAAGNIRKSLENGMKKEEAVLESEAYYQMKSAEKHAAKDGHDFHKLPEYDRGKDKPHKEKYRAIAKTGKYNEEVESVDEAGRWDNSSTGKRYRQMSPEEKARIAQKNRVMKNAKAVYGRNESVEEAMSPAERKVAAGKIFQMHQAKARNNQAAKSDAMKAAKSYKTSDDSHLDAKPSPKPKGKRGHSEAPHIVGQLRGVIDTKGNHKGVQFKDGSTKKVSADHAKKWLAKHDSAKPHQKLAMYKSHDNHGAFKSSLGENYFNQFFTELKIATMTKYKAAAKADNQTGENARHKGYPEKDVDARQAKRDSGIATADKRIAKKQVKMAKGVAFDKRYKGGNMTGATKAIDKIKPGLSNHPKVAGALKRANEQVDFAKSLFAVEAIERRADRKTIIATDPATGRKVVKIAPKKEIDVGKGKMR